MQQFFRVAQYALFLAGVLAVCELGAARNGDAQTAPAAPSASPSPSTPSDPCGGDSRMLATLNRPTIGYSVCAVEAGTVLFEEGYQNQQQDAALSTFLAQYPQSFTRVGVRPRFELDIIGPNFNRQATPDGTGGFNVSRGYSDSGLGFKYEFAPKKRVTFAIDGLYTAPNGSPGFTAGGPTETANLDASYAITPTFGIGTTQAFSSTSGFKTDGTQARYGTWMPSVVLTQQLNGFYQVYAEYVYQSKLAPDRGGRAFVDYGLQHQLGRRFELDVEMANSITSDRSQRFQYFGVGFGWQI